MGVTINSLRSQPYEFISKNNLSFFQGNVVKYVCRYLHKNGIEDLEKIKHYCDLEIKKLKDKKKSEIIQDVEVCNCLNAVILVHKKFIIVMKLLHFRKQNSYATGAINKFKH